MRLERGRAERRSPRAARAIRSGSRRWVGRGERERERSARRHRRDERVCCHTHEHQVGWRDGERHAAAPHAAAVRGRLMVASNGCLGRRVLGGRWRGMMMRSSRHRRGGRSRYTAIFAPHPRKSRCLPRHNGQHEQAHHTAKRVAREQALDAAGEPIHVENGSGR